METVTLIYNKQLFDGPTPIHLSGVKSVNKVIKAKHPHVAMILWGFNSAYYSWGILASGGGYVFSASGNHYNAKDVGVANSGAVEESCQIIALIQAGILPKSITCSRVESEICRGKAAMIISGPWARENRGKAVSILAWHRSPGSMASLDGRSLGSQQRTSSRSSSNTHLAQYLSSIPFSGMKGLTAMDEGKPIGVPALQSVYRKMANDNSLLKGLNVSISNEVMPKIPQMGRFFSAVGSALQIAAQGRASPQEALNDAAAALRFE
ncbi:MAG: extracellular solute-binding protein [Verrucomicrobia bacterium]|nr:extracellular solute-binding protein [Verrucomicrobiota bacterium]